MFERKCPTCGTEFLAKASTRGVYCSRPCVRKKHGMAGTKVYNIWRSMIARCHNENSDCYNRYGGRGIAVCKEWRDSFENFYRDMGDNDNKSIDRIDNDKGYSPENCRWATAEEQQNNTRRTKFITHNGMTMSVTQWERFLGVKREFIRQRLSRGWTAEEALSLP